MKKLVNDPAKAGELAAPKTTFGDRSRYAIAPVHTRFDAVQWFVWDAEQPDDLQLPAVIRQAATMAEALRGLGPLPLGLALRASGIKLEAVKKD